MYSQYTGYWQLISSADLAHSLQKHICLQGDTACVRGSVRQIRQPVELPLYASLEHPLHRFARACNGKQTGANRQQGVPTMRPVEDRRTSRRYKCKASFEYPISDNNKAMLQPIWCSNDVNSESSKNKLHTPTPTDYICDPLPTSIAPLLEQSFCPLTTTNNFLRSTNDFVRALWRLRFLSVWVQS